MLKTQDFQASWLLFTPRPVTRFAKQRRVNSKEHFQRLFRKIGLFRGNCQTKYGIL